MVKAHTAIVSFKNGRVRAVNCECGTNLKLRAGETVSDAWQRHNTKVLAASYDLAYGRA